MGEKRSQLIAKAKEKATKFVQRGDYEKALAEYQTLAKFEPNDLRYRQKLGECLSKLNRKKDAIAEYQKVIKLYADKGFLIQAIAVGKMVLQLDPSLKEIQDEIADLNTRRGITLPKSTVRPALSLKGVSGPIPSAVKPEAPPSQKEPTIPRLFTAAAPPPVASVSDEEALELPADDEEIPPEEETIEPTSEDELQFEKATQENVAELSGDEPDLPEEISTEPAAEKPPEPKPPTRPTPPPLPPRPAPPPPAQAKKEEAPIPLEPAPDDLPEPDAKSEMPPLPETPLFSDLGIEEFKRVMEKFQIGNLPKGITVIKEGTKGDSFYIIAEGKVRVYKWSTNHKRKTTLSVLEEGAFFGEFAFLTNSVRSASVETIEDCVLLRINRKDMEDIIKEFPHVREVMDEFYRKRVVDLLLQISPLFSSLDEADRKSLISKFESVMLDTGDVIIKEGDNGKALYLIKHGAIGISKKNPESGETIQLAVLREGDFFGEISLLSGKPTTADCAALVPTNLFRLPKPAFQEIIMMHPQILETISNTADERIKNTQKSITAKADDRQSSGLV